MKIISFVLGAVFLCAVAAFSHHSFSAEYDATKPVSVTGVVKKVEWQNPHIWIYVDVKDASGKVVKWQFEGGPPNALRRSGWNKDSLKEGDVAKFQGLMSRVDANIGKNTAHAENVTFPNGQRVFAGNAEEAAGDRPAPAKSGPAK